MIRRTIKLRICYGVIFVLCCSNAITFFKSLPPKQETKNESVKETYAFVDLPRFWQCLLIEMRMTRSDNRLLVLKTYMNHYNPKIHKLLPAAALPLFEEELTRSCPWVARDLISPYLSPDPFLVSDLMIDGDEKLAANTR